jgi:hypothetical protein
MVYLFDMSQIKLLKQKKFLPLFITQFLGAFNDNFLKNALVIMVTFHGLKVGNLAPGVMVALIGGCFILPFFLFSAQAGILADRLDKTKLIRYVKIAEIFIMLVAGAGLLTHSTVVLLVSVFLMGVHSTVFGPVKFSILPQHLDSNEIVGGNALIEAGTFLAVLLGTILGGVIIEIPSGNLWVTVGLILCSILGFLSSSKIPSAPPSGQGVPMTWNPIAPTWSVLKSTKKTPSLFNSLMGLSWFWFLGAAFLTLFPTYAKDTLHQEQGVVTLFLCIFSIGIAVGSLLCERLSRHHLELGLVPFGSIGMSLFCADLFFAGGADAAKASGIGVWSFIQSAIGLRIALDLFAFSVFAGFFAVPLNTLIQLRSSANERSRVIAANNIMNALFMVLAAGFLAICAKQNQPIPVIFLSLSIMNVVVAVYIYLLIPEFLLRFIVWGLANIVYRLKLTGRENIPKEGPAVLVCNHVSFVDWMIVAAAIKRPVRFVMDHHFMKGFLIKRLMMRAKVIPIAPGWENPAVLEEAFKTIATELKEGELVCIFPEGKITKDGKMNPFKPGIERIIKETPVPVIPMAILNMWGSFFSREGGRAVFKVPKRFRSRVGLVIDKPIPPSVITTESLFNKVESLLKDS